MSSTPKLDPVPEGEPQSDPAVLDRRGLLGALAGVGAVALGGTLGQSLLVRPAQAQKAGQVRTTTISSGMSGSESFTVTFPPLLTSNGTMADTREPGTWTETAFYPTLWTAMWTFTLPGPLGGTQTVTMAISDLYSYTPPNTVTRTWSWNGTSFSWTGIYTPSHGSFTWTDSYTCTYSTTTPGGNMADEVVITEEVRLDREDGSSVVDSVESGGLNLFDVRSRRGAPAELRFVHGIAG